MGRRRVPRVVGVDAPPESDRDRLWRAVCEAWVDPGVGPVVLRVVVRLYAAVVLESVGVVSGRLVALLGEHPLPVPVVMPPMVGPAGVGPVGLRCGGCPGALVAGEAVVWVPVGPGGDGRARGAARVGLPFDAAVVPVHYACATGVEPEARGVGVSR